MRLKIEKIAAKKLSVQEFYANFYNREQPVLLTGLQTLPENDVLKNMWSLVNTGFAEKRNAHMALPLSGANTICDTPELISSIFSRDDIVYKSKPLKLWLHPRGHQTLLHYDGNSLHGLNWQLAGRKRWLLISPETYPRMMPFSWMAMVKENFEPDPQSIDFYEFETKKGDMLFLPRYWSHQVTSLEECNANINWVWTPKLPNTGVAAGRRECAVLKLRSMLGRLDRHVLNRVSLRNYADGGPEMFITYASVSSRSQLILQLAREIGNTLMLPVFRHRIGQRMQELYDNNFSETTNR